MDEKYKKALKEVWVILENTEENITRKIPTELKNFIFNNMDKNYKFNIDDSGGLLEQNLMIETKGLISILYSGLYMFFRRKK